jgi:hypothetical protein
MSEGQIEKVETGWKKINILFGREDYLNKVRGLLAQFGFEDTEAWSKFNGAWELFLQRPEGVDLTVGCAIPLRETFNLVIGELLRRRPVQEKARGREIISLGEQIGLEGNEPSHFEFLQGQIDGLLDRLSGEKQKIENIRVIEEFLVKGTLLLASFLEALDPGKTRK